MANIVKLILPRANFLVRNTKPTLCASIRWQSNKSQPNLFRVSNMEKRFLVWTGKFKSMQEVPDVLPIETIDRAKNRMRIRIANYMMAATLITCVFVSLSGRRAHQRGESITQRNLDWHQKINEEAKRKEEEEAAKTS